MKTDFDTNDSIATLGDALPRDTREDLQRVFIRSRGLFGQVRDLVVSRPVALVCIFAACAGAIWYLNKSESEA